MKGSPSTRATLRRRCVRAALGSCPVFEVSHSERAAATPAAIWALWEDPARWPDWNEQVEWAEFAGDLAPGAGVTIKFRRGGKMRFEVVALERGRLLIDEAKLPGCRLGHEHRVEPADGGCEISHRLYIAGPLSGFFSRLFGQKRMQQSVRDFIARERELAE